MKRITVLAGNYGSGKTELSLNIALMLAKQYSDVTLVDLDIVNPYFRASEHRRMLEERGIRVVAPVYANTAVELPTLPPDVFSAFGGGHAVFDCGGDPVGAAALGGLKPHFDAVRSDTQMLYVVNTMRPFQDSAARIADSLAKIQMRARLSADGFVFNANLGPETTGEALAAGYDIICAASKMSGVPVAYVSGTEAALSVFKAQHPGYNGAFLPIDIYMRPYWMAT